MSRSPADVKPMIPRVPESMKSGVGAKASYIPRLIGMGPYHHFHPQLLKMEGVKLAAAKLMLQRFNIPDFKSFVRELRPLIPRIQACYDGATAPTGFFSPELEWAMAVDGLFLLSLLCDADAQLLFRRLSESAFSDLSSGRLTVAKKAQSVVDDFWKSLRPSPPPSSPRRPPAASQHLDLLMSAVLNDAVLLENQIPISILSEAVAGFRPDIRRLVADGLDSLCSFLSPIQLPPTPVTPIPAAHLLEYLYLKITGGHRDSDPAAHSSVNVAVDGGRRDVHDEILQHIPDCLSPPAGGSFDIAGILPPVFAVDRSGKKPIIQQLATVLSFGLVDYFIGGTPRNEARKTPTATQLAQIGLRFVPKAAGGRHRATIEFDEETRTIAVPVLRWHPYSNVVIRNLLAYEVTSAAAAAGGLEEYVHFLHMVARTRRDVEMLIESGVVVMLGDDPAMVEDSGSGIGTLLVFLRSLHMKQGGGDGIVAGHEAVKRYYNSRPRVVAGGRFVTIGYVFALVLLFSAEVITNYVAAVSLLCGLLKTFTDCTTGGEQGSCSGNVTANLISAVVYGDRSFHLDK